MLSLLPSPRHQEGLYPFLGGRQLVLLNGPGRIHMLGADARAISDKSATPNSIMLREDVETLVRHLITGIHVIMLRQ
jgi:hypothetical protein